MEKVFGMSFGRIYPLYVQKVEKKGHTRAELDEDISWLTGYDAAQIQAHADGGTTLADFFDAATLNPRAHLITGVICGKRVEDIADPLMQRIRYMDKVVDELARGKRMAAILR